MDVTDKKLFTVRFFRVDYLTFSTVNSNSTFVTECQIQKTPSLCLISPLVSATCNGKIFPLYAFTLKYSENQIQESISPNFSKGKIICFSPDDKDVSKKGEKKHKNYYIHFCVWPKLDFLFRQGTCWPPNTPIQQNSYSIPWNTRKFMKIYF